jgi:hypothetical protein
LFPHVQAQGQLPFHHHDGMPLINHHILGQAIENHTVISNDQPPLTRSDGNLCPFVSLSNRTHINTVDSRLTTSVTYTRTEHIHIYSRNRFSIGYEP